MKKFAIFCLFLLLVSVGTLTFASSKPDNYVKLISPSHSFTKALCTTDNFCQDYEIFCLNSDIISRSAITGAAVQFSETWSDPRTDEMKNKSC